MTTCNSLPTKVKNEHKITQTAHAYFMFVWNTSRVPVKKINKTKTTLW